MDFLDPRKKRARKIRLAIGHVLMALLVLIGTYILVFIAYGYDYNPKTGQVVQEGLVYIDSAPDGAKITINGLDKAATTNTRISLPEGIYTMQISKPGYETWQRSFDLQGGEVLRFTYPVLFPSGLDSSELAQFKSPIDFASQSPDRRWIVIEQKNKPSSMTLFDLQKRNNKLPTSNSLSLPDGLFSGNKGSHHLKLVEWSTDNRHLLVRHDYGGGFEFVMIDIKEPDQSYNINKLFNRKPDKVTLFDKKFDKLMLYDAKTNSLSRADTKNKSVQPFLSSVLSYKTHGNDTVLYARPSVTDKKKADIVIRQKNKDYVIKKIPISTKIPLDIARYNGSWYIVVGSVSEKRSYVYKDPVDLVLNHQQDIDSVRAIVLRNTGLIDEVSFSQNTRFILSHSGQNFSIYDAELQQHFSYTLSQKISDAQEPFWMDGHRLITSTSDKIFVFDYDGINRRSLVSADPSLAVMFNNDYREMYSIDSSKAEKGQYALYLTQLRTPPDR